MKRAKFKKTVAILVVLCLVCLFPAPLVAAEDVPKPVMDARNGVVRIISEYEEEIGIGTGFAVGNDEEMHIVTNQHVVEDAEAIYVYYDTELYVEATVLVTSDSRDLCVLKLEEKVPAIVPLALETEEFDSGMAVYALGYPFAADTLTMDIDALMNGDDITFDAGKEAITVTDGIISGIRESTAFGNGSKRITAIQTNTSISGGNSGGPLLSKEGYVVGVNTLSSALDTNINASVHVQELISLLRNNDIAYTGPAAEEDLRETPAENLPAKKGSPVVWVILGVLVLGAGCAVLVLVLRKRAQKKSRQGVSLQDYLRGGR